MAAELRPPTVAPCPAKCLSTTAALSGGEVIPRRPLHAAHQGLGEPGGQVRILAEALLGPAPARVAREVERGDQGHVAAAGAQFGGGMGGGLLVQLRVPGGADRQVDRQQAVPSSAMEAVRHLLDQQAGMPSRLFSTTCRWTASETRAPSAAPMPVAAVTPDQGSARWNP